MQLSGLHLLLTYQCTFECDHCFVWGSPSQSGTFTLEQIDAILDQAETIPTIQSIYFEGGEPFLYYPILVRGVEHAARRGYSVGIVSNAYWATNVDDALEWLRPLAGKVEDLSVSSDLFHYSEAISRQSQAAEQAARRLGIPAGMISIAQPESSERFATGQLPEGESGVMYRGRAAVKLADKAQHYDWQTFDACPHEDLREPGRVHIDPFGNLHLCQGILIGNLFKNVGRAVSPPTPDELIPHPTLAEICQSYDPDTHPIVGPLLKGGPAALAEAYEFQPEPAYADACHLCYETRLALRPRFVEILAPGQVYGEIQ